MLHCWDSRKGLGFWSRLFWGSQWFVKLQHHVASVFMLLLFRVCSCGYMAAPLSACFIYCVPAAFNLSVRVRPVCCVIKHRVANFCSVSPRLWDRVVDHVSYQGTYVRSFRRRDVFRVMAGALSCRSPLNLTTYLRMTLRRISVVNFNVVFSALRERAFLSTVKFTLELPCSLTLCVPRAVRSKIGVSIFDDEDASGEIFFSHFI